MTGADPSPNQAQEQLSKLQEISEDLSNDHKIDFTFEFLHTLHDRLIRLNTGWVIKLGRGLDIYKNSKSIQYYPIGISYDMDLSPCLQTYLDIYHDNSAQEK